VRNQDVYFDELALLPSTDENGCAHRCLLDQRRFREAVTNAGGLFDVILPPTVPAGIRFIVPLVLPASTEAAAALSAAAAYWMQTRTGRMIRIEIGDLQFEACTSQQFDRFLQQVIL
jgi:hypothetical protein